MRWRCKRKGHDWFPNLGMREFVPQQDICLRCGTVRTLLPYGTCLGGHPLAEHYDDEGHMVPHRWCPGPR